MIKQKDKERFKKVLGRRYAPDIVRILEEKGITKSNGESYTENYVRQVFNGRFDNLEVISVIIEYYNFKKRKIDRMKKKIDKMEHKKSPSGNLDS